MQIIPSASVNLAKLGSNPPPWGATHIFALTPALRINNVRPCPVNVNLRKKMHLVSRGAATTPNISASGLYTRPYRVFTAVGGVSKVCYHHGDNSHGDNTTCLSLGTREYGVSARTRATPFATQISGESYAEARTRWHLKLQGDWVKAPGTSAPAGLSKPHPALRLSPPTKIKRLIIHNVNLETGVDNRNKILIF